VFRLDGSLEHTSDGFLMCGIAGVLFKESLASNDVENACFAMTAKLTQRGPDDAGVFIGEEKLIGLVHTRLAILDLSSSGHQPMLTQDGRYVLVFNGEIYNFLELREKLEQEGQTFVSESDSEVLLRTFVRYGTECTKHLVGMYAFAIWDSKEKVLFAARDPFGIKPLYFWKTNVGFGFASEIRALLELPLGPKQLDYNSVCRYLKYGSVPEPDTMIEGIQMLPAGHMLSISKGRLETRAHWELQFKERAVSLEDAIATTREALLSSVERHFVSDVPVGIFLSGGIDSTALLAIANAIGKRDIHTFCVSFDDLRYKEGDLAMRTAQHFGATHHEWTISRNEACMLFPGYLESTDQPSIDGFNMYCVSSYARQHGMKVVLSGLGGDEMFGSYPSFQTIPKLLKLYKTLSFPRAFGRIFQPLLKRVSFGNKGNRLRTFLLGDGSTLDAYEVIRIVFSDAEIQRFITKRFGKQLQQRIETCTKVGASTWSIADEISYLEITKYMRNQLLRDADVMSMRWGLELRVPFVDSRLMETLSSIPSSIRLTSNKLLLLRAVPEIPEWIIGQPKKGFSFPLETWFDDSWGSGTQSRKTTFPCDNWYQKWCLTSLEKFLSKNQIETQVL
jgi:asparagine synthase (glutamine-hydrolysing)